MKRGAGESEIACAACALPLLFSFYGKAFWGDLGQQKLHRLQVYILQRTDCLCSAFITQGRSPPHHHVLESLSLLSTHLPAAPQTTANPPSIDRVHKLLSLCGFTSIGQSLSAGSIPLLTPSRGFSHPPGGLYNPPFLSGETNAQRGQKDCPQARRNDKQCNFRVLGLNLYSPNHTKIL